MRALLHRLPKPLLFALLGGLGCVFGALPGEWLLAALRPPASPAGTNAPVAAPLVVARVAAPPEPQAFAPQLVARLQREEAKTGDVQISLMWDSLNDLDLHCIGPDGERIYHNHRRSKSGGELDVDMNARYTGRSEVLLLLDCSGSMIGRRMEEAKLAAADLALRLPFGMPVGVIGFHSTADNRLRMTNDPQTVAAFVRGLGPAGSTRMDLALLAAGDEFNRADHARPATTTNAPLRSVLLFTDGQPDKGTEEATLTAARNLRRAGAKVIAVGTGDAKLDFLTQLTDSTNLVFIATDGNLARAFASAENLLKSPDWNRRAQPAVTNAPPPRPVSHVAMLAMEPWIEALFVSTNIVLKNGRRIPTARTNFHFLTAARSLLPPNAQLGFVAGGATNLVLLPPADPSTFTNHLARELRAPPDARTAGAYTIETFRAAVAAVTSALGGWPAALRATNTSSAPLGTVVQFLQRTLHADWHAPFIAELETARRGGVKVLLVETYRNDFLPQAVREAADGVVNQMTATRGPMIPPGATPMAVQAPVIPILRLMGDVGQRLTTLEFAHVQSLQPASARVSKEPVENIFWPKGAAPAGKYLVEVVHFGAHASAEPTSYFVGLKLNGQVHEFKGHIAPGQTNRVHEFNLRSAADLAREQQAKEAAARAERRAQLLRGDPADGPGRTTAGFGRNLLAAASWSAALAVGLAALVTLGQALLLRARWLAARRTWAVLAAALGAGLLSGAVSQGGFAFFASGATSLSAGAAELLRFGQVVGWAVLGALVGLGLAFAVPNLPAHRSALAGAGGGAVGALAFLALTVGAGETAGRLLGAAVLGTAIGLVVALVERLAREAALVVHWHENERTVINLGAEPVILGSSPEAHLYLPKHKGFPPITAIVTFSDGRVQMENKLSNSTHTLAGGNKLQIGELWIEIQTDAK
jgi:Mg-chelatase subunit ChlD